MRSEVSASLAAGKFKKDKGGIVWIFGLVKDIRRM